MLYATAEGKPALEAEHQDAGGICPAWAELVDQAGLVDFNLSETKTAFSITTRQQVTKQSCARLSYIAAPHVPGLSSQEPTMLRDMTCLAERVRLRMTHVKLRLKACVQPAD